MAIEAAGVMTTAYHRLVPTDSGTTVELLLEFEGLLGWLIGKASKRLTREYMTMEAERLKHRSERSATELILAEVI